LAYHDLCCAGKHVNATILNNEPLGQGVLGAGDCGTQQIYQREGKQLTNPLNNLNLSNKIVTKIISALPLRYNPSA
jgi:hypothetical protein